MQISYYPYYDPSVPGAAVVSALFFLGLAISTFQTIRTRAWIWFVMLLAIAMEAVGYAARVNSAQNQTGRTIYIIQFCLIVLAPVFMAGIVYVAFGRIVFLVVPASHRTLRLLWVPARWLTPIFVFFDIFALLLQLIGAVMISATQATDNNAATKLQHGKDIALAGVTTQLAAFGLFTVIAARFHFTSRRFAADLESRFRPVPGGKSKLVTLDDSPRRFRPHWRHLLYAINFACTMIIIRSIYREIEFALGKSGYTQRHEWCGYVLDALPMLLLVIVFIVFPPGAYVTMGWRQPKDKARMALRSQDSGNYGMHTYSTES